ncbi:MAG: DEAD/DEAH box helicase family protein [Acidimicrobiales bacterium]
MSDEPRTYRTKTGRVLTAAEIEALADEAEQGYDIEHLARGPGRPRMGSAPAVLVPVRLHADLHDAVKVLAKAERTSVSELVRDALREFLATPAATGALRTASGRLIADADVVGLADEAEAGYDITTLSGRKNRRVGARAEVVPVRMPPELKADAEERAEAQATSVSEIVRAALRARLEGGGDNDPPSGGARSRASRHGPTEADTCRDYVVPQLKDAGWSDDQIVEQYRITDGRVFSVGKKHRRDTPLRADYVLEYRPGFPIAVVEAKRSYAMAGKGLQQAKRYASLLDVPFSYSTNGKGIIEDDSNTGIERDDLAGFPSPDVLWARFREGRGIDNDLAAGGLLAPFNRALRSPDGSVKEPRYYQRTAINRAVRAVLRGDDRLLLTMATGTGKTFVAMQIVWKLWNVNWRPGRNPRILYLADRNVLIDQPIEREFKPAFGGEGSPIWKLRGEAKPGREIYFGLYQQLADSAGGLDGMYRDFAPDFFDLVIVDECHRGSSRADSSWRAILQHFTQATQLGMTATPKRDESVDTYDYFGGSIFEYSLAQGIDDGFLAPYRVRRVVLSPDALGWAPDQGQLDLFGNEVPEGLYTTKDFERVVSLLTRTEAAAKHLTEYLRRTNRWAKTIVFCVNQEHADQMRRALHNANADLAKDYPNYVVRIVSEEGDVGRSHLSDFADTETPLPVIATTSEMLSTGVDLPTVKNIVLFRTIGSMALFKQMIGRGTRLFPDEDKLSFDILDYSGATALFNDPEFDGPPEQVVDEEIDREGNVTDDTVVEQPEPTIETPQGDSVPDNIPPGDLDDEPRAKFYIEDAEVWVTAEAVYHLDPDTERLRLVEYRDFVAETVRSLFPDANELRSRWHSRVGREDVLDALARHGIDADDLVERTSMADADPLDVLVHVAWNQPLATRVERARRVRREHEAFFEEFQPAAREVLAYLLDKYAEHGISELDDLAVLEVPPLSSLGTPAEIAARFGSPDALRTAISRLSALVYVA